MNGVKILQIIFDGEEGKLYRNMLFESIESEKKRKHNKHKRRRKKKKKKNGQDEELDFMEGMIKSFGLSHLFEIDKNPEEKGTKNNDEKEKEEDDEKRIIPDDDNDVQMSDNNNDTNKNISRSSSKEELSIDVDAQTEKVKEMKLDSPEQSTSPSRRMLSIIGFLSIFFSIHPIIHSDTTFTSQTNLT